MYGGLHFGPAGVFGWAALAGEERFGLVLALGLYVPIVAFRIVGLLRNRPVGSVTRVVAALEAALLAFALARWFGGAR